MKKIALLIALTCLCGNLSIFASAKHHTEPSTEKSTPSQTITEINLNTADETALTKIKGIGNKRAQAIIAYRTQHGNFASMEDLTHVKGLTKKVLDRLVDKNPNISIVAKSSN